MFGPTVIGTIRLASPAPSSTADLTTIGAGTCALDSGRNARAARIARTAIGTLMRKIGRHDIPHQSPAVMTPPSSGPATAANPITEVNIPMAVPRCAGGYNTWMQVSTCGTIRAAASP